MSLKQQISDYRIKHKESRLVLGVLLGEFERIEKAPKRKNPEITDDECIAIIKKLIDSNIQCNQLEENKILEQFLPQQLPEGSIMILLLGKKFSNIGECMKFFKEYYPGRYDGGLVSKCFKKLNP